jgi:hypothetical protein
MKRQNLFVRVKLFLFVTFLCIYAPVFGGQIGPTRPNIWGISNTSLTIPQGSIITEAVLTIRNITNLSENGSDTLYIRLMDDPPLGFQSVDNNIEHNTGVLLIPPYHDLTAGDEDLTYTFSDLNDESSALWNVFNHEDPSMTGYSSLLLQLIDYAGNGTPFGFAFDPNGISAYTFEEITLDLMVESFRDQVDQYIITFSTSLSLIEPIGDRTVDEKKVLAFEVIAAGTNGEPISCWAENLPEGATFDSNIFNWRPWYGDAGSYDVTFVASNGFQEDSNTITITVNPVKLASWYERWRKHLDSF